MVTTEVEFCWNCKKFDTNDGTGRPVGTITLEGRTLKLGYCRAPKGLVFGILNESTRCKRPQDIFKQFKKS